jgi:hypothetical protein
MEHKDPDLIFRELRSPPVQLLREREKQVEQKKRLKIKRTTIFGKITTTDFDYVVY